MASEEFAITRAGVAVVSGVAGVLVLLVTVALAWGTQASQVDANTEAIEKLSGMPEQVARVEERQIAQSEQLDILVGRVERYKED